MLDNGQRTRDPFTFSLGGMATIASFAFAPAVANDRINKIRDNGLNKAQNDRNRESQTWQPDQGRTAQSNCA
ncbi:MAG: hypothetical protein HKN35_07615 [Woeseia sp.]|nr:hypothetical protein [Woeseia sp.]NNE60745.1 hypothetical protein [Woeseia sp.]